MKSDGKQQASDCIYKDNRVSNTDYMSALIDFMNDNDDIGVVSIMVYEDNDEGLTYRALSNILPHNALGLIDIGYDIMKDWALGEGEEDDIG